MRPALLRKLLLTLPFPALCIAVLVVLVNGCGNAGVEHAKIELNGHQIVWTGYADTDQELKASFDATCCCLQGCCLRIRHGYAFVVVIDGTFKCNGVLARGCAELGGDTIYIDKAYLYTPVFAHEVVHWVTGMGNSFHDSSIFNACIPPESDSPASEP